MELRTESGGCVGHVAVRRQGEETVFTVTARLEDGLWRIVACGSAMHAGMAGKHLIEELARIPVQVEIASEFRYENLVFRKGDAVDTDAVLVTLG